MKNLIIIALCLLVIAGCRRPQPQPPVQPPPIVVEPVKPIDPPPIVKPQVLVEGTYKGTWVTTNRKLDGSMTCVVKSRGIDKWSGHFDGVWMGRRFAYDVQWSGPSDDFRGEAVIDRADYQWTGFVDLDGNFKGKFTGNRYNGHFDLKKEIK